ncbi:MAG: hypothetical protein ACRYFU_05690 [Janthinobacterium lividum]
MYTLNNPEWARKFKEDKVTDQEFRLFYNRLTNTLGTVKPLSSSFYVLQRDKQVLASYKQLKAKVDYPPSLIAEERGLNWLRLKMSGGSKAAHDRRRTRSDEASRNLITNVMNDIERALDKNLYSASEHSEARAHISSAVAAALRGDIAAANQAQAELGRILVGTGYAVLAAPSLALASARIA